MTVRLTTIRRMGLMNKALHPDNGGVSFRPDRQRSPDGLFRPANCIPDGGVSPHSRRASSSPGTRAARRGLRETPHGLARCRRVN